MLKEIFYNILKNFQIFKDLFGKPLNHDWVARVIFPIQILLILGSQKYSYSSCQQDFLKVDCYCVYRKLIMWSSFTKGPFSTNPEHVTSFTVERSISTNILYLHSRGCSSKTKWTGCIRWWRYQAWYVEIMCWDVTTWFDRWKHQSCYWTHL